MEFRVSLPSATRPALHCPPVCLRVGRRTHAGEGEGSKKNGPRKSYHQVDEKRGQVSRMITCAEPGGTSVEGPLPNSYPHSASGSPGGEDRPLKEKPTQRPRQPSG